MFVFVSEIKVKMRKCVAGITVNPTFWFPKSEEKREKWINSLTLSDPPTQNSRICWKHFRKEDIVSENGKCVVSPHAIPSLNPALSSPDLTPTD